MVRTVRTCAPVRRVSREGLRTVSKAPFEATGVDWEAVERDYRAGQLSNRALAAEHGISESAVRKEAKKHGWIKGEAHAIRARAREKANEKALPRYIEASPERVEQLAEVASHVLVRHRTAASVMAGLAADMVQQLRHQTDHEPELADAIEDFYMAKAQQNPLLAGVYKQQCNNALHAISLGARSKTMLNLTGAVGKLVEIERKAWNLDDEGDNRSYEDLLAELHAKTGEGAANDGDDDPAQDDAANAA